MKKNVFQDDGGYAIVLAIMLLATLMMGGVLLSNSSVTDLGVVKNTVVHSQNLAVAESAAMTAVQIIEANNEREKLFPTGSGFYENDLETASEQWININNDIPDSADENSSTYDKYWKAMSLSNLGSVSGRASIENAKVRYRLIGWKPAKGSSTGAQNQRNLHEATIRGVYYSAKYGAASVEMGFKKYF